jgi:hypothetical protein
MKALWITHRRPSEMSATTRKGVANALENRDWTIEFMGPDADHHVHRSTFFGRGHPSFTRALNERLTGMDLSEFSIAIVEWTAVSGAAEALLNAGLPWIIMDRSPPVSTGWVGWFQRVQYREAWAMADIFAKGRAVKSPHMAATRAWEGPSAVVAAGVDASAFTCAEMNEEAVIVCHGSLSRERELHRLVEMGLEPYLFGAGNDAARLAQITRVEGPGPVAQRLAACDVGVMHLPDREVWRHASPLKVAEFAAAGLLVVSSEVSGLEHLRGAEWLTLVPLGDDEAFLIAVESLRSLPLEERRRRGKVARQDAEERMNWMCCTEALHDLLLEVKR